MGLIINYWWVVLIIAGIVMLVGYMKRKDDFNMPHEKLQEVYKKEVENTVEVTGTQSYKNNLKIGHVSLGKIKKVANINWYKKSKDKKAEHIKFLQISTIQNGTIHKFLSMFGIGIRYFLVDKEYIKSDFDNTNSSDIVIDENTQYWNSEGIGIFSKKGREYLESLAWKKAHTSALEEFVNFIPKQTYLEVRQAKLTEKARMLTALEKDRWGSRVEQAVTEE